MAVIVTPPRSDGATEGVTVTSGPDEPGDATRGSVPGGREPFRLRELVPVTLLGIVAPILAFGMWPFDRPVVYSQDAFQHLALARTADWLGTPGTSAGLNAPHGLDWAGSLPTGTERLHVWLIRLVDRFTDDPFVMLNVVTVVGVAATIVVSYLVLRWLGGRRSLATLAAIAFAFSPALTDRLAAGHLFLFPLFPVALGVYLAVLASRWPAHRGRPALIAPAAAIVIVAMSSSYYATFTVVLVAVLGGLVAVRSADWRRLVAPGLVILALVAGLGLTLLPDVVARSGSPTADGFTRSVQDSDRYGLRLAQLVLPPPTTRLPLVGHVAARASWTESIGDGGVSIGVLGTAGLLAVGWVLLRRVGRPRDDVDRTVTRLGALIGSAVALATVGGGGFLLAALGFTQIRVWSRVAAFVGFAALAGLLLIVQRRFGARRDLIVWATVIVVLGLVEHPLVPPVGPIDAAVGADRALVSSLERQVPREGSVLELPAVPFPDDLGAERLLAPSLLAGDRLRFSAGDFRGGTGDWQQSWLTGDVGRDTLVAALAGFDAVVLQRTHKLVDDPDRAVEDMERVSGEPSWRSKDDGWAWVDVRPLRRRLAADHGESAVDEARRLITRPLGFTYDDWRLTSWDDDRAVQELGPDAAIDLHPLDGGDGAARVSFDVGAAEGATVVIEASGAEPVEVRPGPAGTHASIVVPRVAPGTSVRIRSDGPEVPITSATPASVWVSDVQVVDEQGARLVDSVR